MLLNFIFSNINIIALAIWFAFYIVVVIRTFRPAWIKHVSYTWLIACAISLHLIYGIFLTWGQYFVWSKSEFTKIFLSSALPKEVPFPTYLEFVRPLFSGAHGYFALYAFEHFFLGIIALFFVTGLFALFFKLYAHYRPALFQERDIAVIALAFLIAGWPGAIVLVPLSFVIAVFITSLSLLKPGFNKTKQVSLPLAFLLATPIALLFSTKILTALHLYALLKL